MHCALKRTSFQARELPAATAVLVGAGDEFAVRIPLREARRPQRLPLGADEAVRAVTLELAAIAAVEQRVIRPAGALHHQRLLDQVRHQTDGVACSAT